MSNKICIYAICKNEAKFVDKWYESMKEADEIIDSYHLSTNLASFLQIA